MPIIARHERDLNFFFLYFVLFYYPILIDFFFFVYANRFFFFVSLFVCLESFNSNFFCFFLFSIFKVCEQYKCEPGIFSLSVNYLDRFILAKPNIPKQHLQLAGIVCMLIASKIRQCNTFDLEFLIYASDHAFTVEEILVCIFFLMFSFERKQKTK